MENYIAISELKEKTIDELAGLAKELNVEGATGLRKQDLTRPLRSVLWQDRQGRQWSSLSILRSQYNFPSFLYLSW